MDTERFCRTMQNMPDSIRTQRLDNIFMKRKEFSERWIFLFPQFAVFNQRVCCRTSQKDRDRKPEKAKKEELTQTISIFQPDETFLIEMFNLKRKV